MTLSSNAIDSRRNVDVNREYINAFRGMLLVAFVVSLSLTPAVSTLPSSWLRSIANQQLHSSIWDGLTWIDFTFAAYVVTVGLEISFDLRSDNLSKCRVNANATVFRRAMVLFFVGLAITNLCSHKWTGIRLSGLLQRLAICYLACGLVYLNFSRRIREIAFITILIGYSLVLTHVPSPTSTIKDLSFDGNVVAWIDKHFLPGSAYYGSWDPDGLLTTIPAIASCLFGTLCGDFVLSQYRSQMKLTWLLIGGVALVNFGFLSDSWIPINRSLWTPSYILVTAGIAATACAACFFVTDIQKKGSWLFPFIVIGETFYFALAVTQLIPLGFAARTYTGIVAPIAGRYILIENAVFEALLAWVCLYCFCKCYKSISCV